MAKIMSYNELTRRMATLKARFPQQFAGPHIGISVYPGWLDLFEKLCADIGHAVKEYGNQQALRWRQGEEKRGVLRAYYGAEFYCLDNGLHKAGGIWLLRTEDEPKSIMHKHSQWTKICALVDAGEHASGTTCMFCGAPDRMALGTGKLMFRSPKLAH